MRYESNLILRLLLIFLMISVISGSAPSQALAATSDNFINVSNHLPRINEAADDEPEAPTDTYTIYFPLTYKSDIPEDSWPMVAANPQRTSWTPEEVSGNVHLEWYRTLEAYIPQNAQIIAANGLIYVSTARGLYAFNADNGNVAWRFDTELPLGNSPTISGGVAYVAGFDRKLHALNATNGTHLWAFDGAKAGYDTNPLVVNGKVILGNRDGAMYAIGAHGTSQQGQLIWKYQAGGPIHLSAAYNQGVVYFAANDNYAYALDVNTGGLIWKSSKMPGDGYHSFWPVIFQGKVIFTAASAYRTGRDPGTLTLGEDYGQSFYMDREGIFPGEPDGSVLRPEIPNQSWGNGYLVVDASRITEYFENNPNSHPYKHKPWRRMLIVLNQSNGVEFTFDSDRDGYPEYIPVANWGTQSGNRCPPIVGPNGLLYVSNIYQKSFISQGKVMGWNINTPSFFSILRGQGAVDEPQALSGGGSKIYRNLTDNVADWFDIYTTHPAEMGRMWDYANTLANQVPGYNDMYYDNAVFGTKNGIYARWGIIAPIVPYKGRLYTHRGNSIIAYGHGTSLGRLPTLPINPVVENSPKSRAELIALLEEEIQKIVNAGHIKPGYYNNGVFSNWELGDYFDNPGDTLYTLSIAHPYLSPQLQQQAKAYLQSEFNTYFNPTMYSITGWADGVQREAMPIPNDILGSVASSGALQDSGPRFTWNYPPHNFYAMWKYAQIVPEQAATIYNLAKSKLQVPVPQEATNQLLSEKTWQHNAYITGYIGFLELQELAQMDGVDSQLRQTVTNELNRLLQLRAANFDKDTPWADQRRVRWHLNIARNFMMMSPELGEYLNQNILNEVRVALDEYETVAPYWFVSKYEVEPGEGIMSVLYNYHSIFQARAYILKQSRAELTKYLDVPAFPHGDLLYIQNVIAAIEAGD